jgi:hypothetical protein
LCFGKSDFLLGHAGLLREKSLLFELGRGRSTRRAATFQHAVDIMAGDYHLL